MVSRIGEFSKLAFIPSNVAATAVLAVALRCIALAIAREPFTSDPDGYLALAENVWQHGVLGVGQTPSAYRPPLYPLSLAPSFAVKEFASWYFAAWHVALGVGAAMISCRLAERIGLGRWSLAVGLLVAADPILVRQSAAIMTESLAAFLTTAAWLALARWGEFPAPRRAAIAGAVLGLAALCRPTYLAAALLAGAAVGWRIRGAAGGWRHVAAFTLGLAALLAPWAVRNFLAFGRPIVSTTHGGYTLLLGNNDLYFEHLRTHSWRVPWNADELDARVHADRLATGSLDETELDRRDYDEALSHIRANPRAFVRACFLRVIAFWDVAPRGDAGAGSLRPIVATWYAAQWLAALCGLWALRRNPPRGEFLWGALFVAAFMLAHAVYWCDMRMRAPIAPIVAVAAAAGLRRLTRRAVGQTNGR